MNLACARGALQGRITAWAARKDFLVTCHVRIVILLPVLGMQGQLME